MNGQLVVGCFCVGAAVLGAWLRVRFPAVGPRSLRAIVLAVLAVAAGLPAAGLLFDAVFGAGGYGPPLALLAVVLPALTAAFWVSACVLRALADVPGLRR